MHGSEKFTMKRGVQQGDVISPVLFNAGLEHGMRKWEAKLFHRGVQLGHGNRLTNIRYADDLFFFPPHLFPRLSVAALTVLLGSLQAHDWHEGQKSRAQVCLGRGGVDWRKEGPAGLPLRVGSS